MAVRKTKVAKKRALPKASPRGMPRSVQDEVQGALAWLEQKSTRRDRENLVRFGITASQAFGVSMKNIQVLAKRLGRTTYSPPRSGIPAGTRPAC